MTTNLNTADAEARKSRLRELMVEHQLTDVQVSELLGVSVHTVDAWLKPGTGRSSRAISRSNLELLEIKVAGPLR